MILIALAAFIWLLASFICFLLVFYDFRRPQPEFPVPAGAIYQPYHEVMIDGIKRAEQGDGLILRLYESFGGKAKAKIRVAEGYTKAFLVNLMEENPLPLPIEEGCVSLDFGAFEIHTVLLEK